MKIPWWLYLLLAIFSYALFHYLLPSLKTDNTQLQGFLRFTPQLAPILSIVFLLLAAGQLYDGVPKKKDKEDQEN